jgi:YidC/Oxa1 family membrane protein insertase
MPIIGDLFLQLILFIYNTVAFQNLGVAIIEISLLSRLIFYPFIKQQTHYSRKMSELQPHLANLKEKHKDNKQAFATAQMDLFKQHGVNPAAGCLPAVVQIVVLFGLLGAMNHILTMKLNTSFVIWNMAKPDALKIAGLPFAVPGVLVVVAAITQFVQTKMMMPPPAKASEGQALKKI